jgi:hypothetical protein
MSALEQEIIEIFARLDQNGQQRVLEFARSIETPTQPAEDWFEWAHRFREQLRQKYGDEYYFNVQQTLDDVREERLNDLILHR